MNFASCRVVTSFVLVIVNGQSTTDDDIDKNEINRLIDIVEVLRAEQAELRMESNVNWLWHQQVSR